MFNLLVAVNGNHVKLINNFRQEGMISKYARWALNNFNQAFFILYGLTPKPRWKMQLWQLPIRLKMEVKVNFEVFSRERFNNYSTKMNHENHLNQRFHTPSHPGMHETFGALQCKLPDTKEFKQKANHKGGSILCTCNIESYKTFICISRDYLYVFKGRQVTHWTNP